MDLQWHLTRLQPGSVVALQVSGKGLRGLHEAIVDLVQLGSVLVRHLLPTSHWIWVFVKGGKTILETAVTNNINLVIGDAEITLSKNDHSKFHGIMDEKRWNFCQNHEAHGKFCDFSGFFQKKKLNWNISFLNNILDDVPVIITAGNRPQYLSATLAALMAAPGFIKENLLVLIGGHYPNTIQLLDIMEIQYNVFDLEGNGNAKLFQYYRKVYKYVYKHYFNSKAAIFLDEDVLVSPDFFFFMSQVIPVMLTDKTIYCASAYAHQSSHELYQKKDIVKRGSTQVMWGYALPMTFIREALNNWSFDIRNVALYDAWLYEAVIGNRECIFPEVSRSKHYGTGTNTRPLEYERFSGSMEMVSEAGIYIKNLKEIPRREWENLIENKLRQGTPVYGNPCTGHIFDNLPPGSYVFSYYVKVEDDDMYYLNSYFAIGECLGFNAESEKGWHEGVTLLRVNEDVEIVLIGVPLSRYTYLVEKQLPAWNVQTLSSKETTETNKKMRKYYTDKLLQIDQQIKLNSTSELFNH